MKIDIMSEPSVIGILDDVDRHATALERAGNRHLKDAEKMRDLLAALKAKFRSIKERMEQRGGRRK